MLKKSDWLKQIQTWLTGAKKNGFTMQKVDIANEEYLLRNVNNKDIRELLRIERELYEGETPWNRTAFLYELNAPYPRLYLAVEKSSELVGFIGCRFKNDNGHITNFAVRKSYQKKGIGTHLLNKIKKYAEQNHCVTLSLEVRKSNMDAQRLYRRFGFVTIAIKKNYYNDTKEDAISMQCQIKEQRD